VPVQAAEVADLIEGLRRRALACDLPPPPEPLLSLGHSLRTEPARLLVAGMMKAGKTTFVNALIGRDLLPTDVEVATSQVFDVGPAEHAAFRLRFEDGSCREIAGEDLGRYGSQVVADADGSPRLDQVLRWIEVDVPTRFLPPGMRLLDSPGLGSLYAGHAEITARFASRADGVIYVLDSERPVSRLDLEFLRNVLRVTDHVFFVQTKIDQHSRENWEAKLERNRVILSEASGSALGDIRVWPLSALNLLGGVDEGPHAEAMRLVSRYADFSEALRSFLYGAATGPRLVQALSLSAAYCEAAIDRLANRRDVLLRDVMDIADDAERTRAAALEVEAAWTPAKFGQLSLALERSVGLSKRAFAEALQPGGKIAGPFEEQIRSVGSIAEVKQLGGRLASDVVAAAVAEWEMVCLDGARRCENVLVKFVVPADSYEAAGPDAPEEIQGPNAPPLQKNMFELIRWSYMGWSMGAFGGKMLLVALLGPAVSGPAMIGGIFLIPVGYKFATRNQVRQARGELDRHLREVLQQVHRHFFTVDLTSDRSSRVDEQFGKVCAATEDYAKRAAAETVHAAQQEATAAATAQSIDGSKRRSAAERIAQELREWEAIRAKLHELQSTSSADGGSSAFAAHRSGLAWSA
jgi:GTPase SAR1 family protein